MKKIRQIWDSLFKRPIVKNITITSTAKDALVVKHLVTDTPYTTKALAISKERADEFEKAVKIAFIKHNNTISVAEEVSQMCTHANELFLVVTMINHEHQRVSSPFEGILQDILGSKGKPE